MQTGARRLPLLSACLRGEDDVSERGRRARPRRESWAAGAKPEENGRVDSKHWQSETKKALASGRASGLAKAKSRRVRALAPGAMHVGASKADAHERVAPKLNKLLMTNAPCKDGMCTGKALGSPRMSLGALPTACDSVRTARQRASVRAT